MSRKRKKTLKKHKNKFRFLGILFGVQILFLIFNDFGFITWLQLNSEKTNVHNQVEILLNQQIKLQNEITKLNVDQEYIEQMARERFMLVKPGEKVFRVVESKTMQQ